MAVANNRTIYAITSLFVVSLVSNWVNRGDAFLPISLLFVAFCIMSSFATRKTWSWVFGAMLAFSVIESGYAIIQAIEHVDRAKGTFGSPNFLAGYAVLHIFLCLIIFRRSSIFDLAIIIANVVSLTLSQSRGGIIALAVGTLFLVPFRRWVAVLPGFVGAVAWVLVISGSRAPHDLRWDIWENGVHFAAQKLLLGWGWGSFNVAGQPVQFYNVALDIVIGVGVVGLISALWVLFETVRSAATMTDEKERRPMLAFIAAWTVNGMLIYQTPETFIPAFLVVAFLTSPLRDVADTTVVIDDH